MKPAAQYERLLHRSQFVLGPRFVEQFPAWHRFSVGEGRGLCLTVHPELKVHVARLREKTIILLGFILDPHNPQATDSDIVSVAVKKGTTLADHFDEGFRDCIPALRDRVKAKPFRS